MFICLVTSRNYFFFTLFILLSVMDIEAQSIPGQFVTLATGQQIHVYSQGTGDTTLVFTSGFGSPGSYTDFKAYADACSDNNRVVLYDRPGTGWSPEPDSPYDISTQAATLHATLEALGVNRNMILVAHSFGALEAIHFASLYPEKVIGLVFIDGVSPQTYRDFDASKSVKILSNVHRMRGLFKALVSVGFIGEANRRSKLLSPALRKTDRALLKRNFANQTMIETARQVKPYGALVQAALPVPAVPVLVFSCRHSFTELGFSYTNWEADQALLVSLSPQSSQVFIPGKHATVHLSEKDVVIAAMRERWK